VFLINKWLKIARCLPSELVLETNDGLLGHENKLTVNYPKGFSQIFGDSIVYHV
jgi:hypothetical protein